VCDSLRSAISEQTLDQLIFVFSTMLRYRAVLCGSLLLIDCAVSYALRLAIVAYVLMLCVIVVGLLLGIGVAQCLCVSHYAMYTLTDEL
jgi:hypothetical protein